MEEGRPFFLSIHTFDHNRVLAAAWNQPPPRDNRSYFPLPPSLFLPIIESIEIFPILRKEDEEKTIYFIFRAIRYFWPGNWRRYRKIFPFRHVSGYESVRAHTRKGRSQRVKKLFLPSLPLSRANKDALCFHALVNKKGRKGRTRERDSFRRAGLGGVGWKQHTDDYALIKIIN